VYRSNSLVTTENVTTSGPTATATLSGLNSATEYRVEVRGIIDVVSQSMPVSKTFRTLGELPSFPASSTDVIGAAVGGAVGGLVLVILIAVVM
jgi:hypothetical protein